MSKAAFVDMEVEYVDHMGSDVNVVNAARCSFAKEVKEFDLEKDTKLINYLAKHGHWSPLAHTSITIRIKAPVYLARQYVKHQVGLVWNEESRRYIDESPEFHIPNEWRGRPVNAKQGSTGVVTNQEHYSVYTKEHTQACLDVYENLLSCDVAPEQCRMVLPQNTMTNWMWTGSVVAFARVVNQRVDAHAQKEAQELGMLIREAVKDAYPVSWEALMDV